VTTRDRTWDAIVIGAGPAGSVSALSMARGGARVLLVERATLPRWKVCGACLSTGGLAILGSLGLSREVRARGGAPLETLALVAGGRRADVPLRGGVSLSRTELDVLLAEAAEAAGACLVQGARATVRDVVEGARLVLVERRGEAEEHRASVVIDATGLGHAPGRVAPGSRVGLGATFDALDGAPPRGELRMVVGSSGYVGLVRLEDGRVNVGAAVDPVRLGAARPAAVVDGILAEAGHEPLRIGGRAPHPRHGWRGTPALTRRALETAGERLLRVGDALGYVEPFTGEGMCWALDSGVAAARIALRGCAAWHSGLQQEWRAHQLRTAARSRRLCRALAWGLRRPSLVGPAVALLRVAPALAAPFVRSASGPPSRAGRSGTDLPMPFTPDGARVA